MVYQRGRFTVNMQRLKILKAISLILCVCVLSGCSKNFVVTTKLGDKELFRIEDASASLSEMMLYLTTIQNQYEKVYGSEIWNQTASGETFEEQIKSMVLAKLAQVKVMNLMAESYKVTLSGDEETKLQTVSENFYNSLTDTEKEVLSLTQDDIYSYYKELLIASKLYEYVIRDVNPEISDDEARIVTVQEIFIKTYSLDANGNHIEYSDRGKSEAYEKAEVVRAEALLGEVSFESLAGKYNEDDELTRTLSQGSDDNEVAETAFNLSKDEISDIIRTSDGYYILKCISDFDLEETLKNKETILEKRKEEAFDEAYETYADSLTKLFNEKLYKSITLIHNSDVTTDSFFDADL